MGALEDIKGSAAAGKLVVVSGAGISMSLAHRTTPAVNWPALLDHAFMFAQRKGKLDEVQYRRWKDALTSSDLDDLLSAADFVSRKLGGGSGLLYAQWLNEAFSGLRTRSGPMRDALAALDRSRIPICTLNYDTLAERVTRLPSIHMGEPRKVMDWARRDGAGVLHLHGVWDVPETCVLGISDYIKATSDEFRNNLQRALSSFNRLLFIGCGDTINDPNFSSLITWMKAVVGSAGLQHYALVHNNAVEAKDKDELWHGFVQPIGYGDSYDDLPKLIIKEVASAAPTNKVSPRRSRSTNSPVVSLYREYLIRDCGQMTIEGVRADADTAKQKFEHRTAVRTTFGSRASARATGERSPERAQAQEMARGKPRANSLWDSLGQAFAACTSRPSGRRQDITAKEACRGICRRRAEKHDRRRPSSAGRPAYIDSMS